MALSREKTYDIYDGLKYNFLYNKDINCIHILLNLYEIENNINNIFPRYISMHNLRKSISRFLKDKRGNHLIAYNLGQLIHEDINRLELYLYIEGYRDGYLSNKATNGLENLAIKYYSISELYNLKYLFHYNSKGKEISDYKNKVFNNLEIKEENTKELTSMIETYCETIIRPKVKDLNRYLDKQLTLSINLEKLNIKEDSSALSDKELDEIYNEVCKIILKQSYNIYKDAYWNGLNDRLLKRYK